MGRKSPTVIQCFHHIVSHDKGMCIALYYSLCTAYSSHHYLFCSYISSFLIHAVSHNLGLATPDLCTLTFLRGLNVVFTVVLFLVVHSILKGIHGKESLCKSSPHSSPCTPPLSHSSFYKRKVGVVLVSTDKILCSF